VTIEPDPVDLLQSGGVHIRPHMALSGHSNRASQCPLSGGKADMAICGVSAFAVAIGCKADMKFCNAHVCF
jgi:hypothetical protein